MSTPTGSARKPPRPVSSSSRRVADVPSLAGWFGRLAAAVAVLVLIQAALAGQALFGSWSIAVHGTLGNLTVVVAAGLLIVGSIARAGRRHILLAAILALVITAQVGLGYAGRDSAESAAWHIPNGVLAFGLAVHLATMSRRTTG